MCNKPKWRYILDDAWFHLVYGLQLIVASFVAIVALILIVLYIAAMLILPFAILAILVLLIQQLGAF